ncbi:hypothetical protein DNTS_014732 [Danionella cerebrum]|uniref:Immunoglobulin domain-containing protein n=1 Tax=Danionella cerebrum TaxID=2873325 RepID=A0A553PMR3_9TELE|nr:hypothetical protein DNTS_014732 [Danionella translucida]
MELLNVWIWIVMMPVLLEGGVLVHFKMGRFLSVALGETLVVEAVFNKSLGDNIDRVTWDREANGQSFRLSEGGRVHFEKEQSLLHISNVTEEDFARYTVTVTDSNGKQQQDSIQVQQIGPSTANSRRSRVAESYATDPKSSLQFPGCKCSSPRVVKIN